MEIWTVPSSPLSNQELRRYSIFFQLEVKHFEKCSGTAHFMDSSTWARDLKNSGKYVSGLSCLIYDLSFRIQAAFHFQKTWVQKTGLIFYLTDFHGRNWRIPGSY